MEYEKVTHREHILKRPDTYVGSLEYDDSLGISPALLKIFDEILVNAFDEHMRDPKMNTIEVSVVNSTITVRNNKCVPVVIHPKEGVYVPELVFGHLLTSSNYDDSKDRYTGGRNGYGAKLTNIFSKRFTVTSCDPENGKEYTQTWKNNMSECSKPSVKKYSKKSGWLTVTFDPDERLVGKIDAKVLRERVREIGLWVPRVSFNGEPVQSDLLTYSGRGTDDVAVAHHKQKSWEIVVTKSDSGFKQKSFVNGISTTTGGTHVEYVIQTLCKSDAFGKDAKPYQVKQHIQVFVKVLVNKPTFTSQTKTECTSKNFEPLEFKPKFLRDVSSLGIENILNQSRLKKSDGCKRSKIQGIPKLDDANWAGSPKSQQCTLILTEGDSAKALAIAGLSVVGRDRFGVFPLKGKPKNVRDSSVKSLESNKEFSDLKKILGLKQNEVYTDTKTLRYGRVLIMTDADLDGSHIKGLVLNMFHCFWPSLLKIGYVSAMVTPVIKVGSAWFFTEDEYRKAKPRGIPKYYKGLGTSTSAEAKEYFKMLDKLTVTFSDDTQTDPSMMLAFSKDMADRRKEWLREYTSLQEKPVVPYGHINNLSISDFIRKDQVKFSEEDIRRSIPHLLDGLKPSQRKVIFACLKKNLERDMTVAQLAGYIGEHTAYHHGDASMHGTIVGLAQDFVGSNNMNLLVPSGQFGSRLEGGKDCASARYISTRLSDYTKDVFDKRDNPILSWLVEDAKDIEPSFYVPVIPMVLVNGCEGIGTGFSTFVPPFNPDDIVANLERLLNKESSLKRMTPYYRGFTGTIERVPDKNNSWILRGTCVRKSASVLHVTELPPGRWIQDYKEFLDELVAEGKIKSYENHSTESNPDFIIYDGHEEDLRLTRTIHATNMYLITKDGEIKKFETPEDILVEYAKIRIEYYKLRKKHMLETIDADLFEHSETNRFIRLVISERIQIFKRTRKEIQGDLRAHEFRESMWDGLLNVKTYQYTSEEIEKHEAKIQQLKTTRDALKKTTVSEMWKTDLALIQEGRCRK